MRWSCGGWNFLKKYRERRPAFPIIFTREFLVFEK